MGKSKKDKKEESIFDMIEDMTGIPSEYVWVILVILFILIKSKMPSELLLKRNNIYFFLTYFFAYFISAYINDIFQITKNSIGVIRTF